MQTTMYVMQTQSERSKMENQAKMSGRRKNMERRLIMRELDSLCGVVRL
jgi:hypothetical protein